MSRFHRLQSQNQLHRPERTGVGDPNSLVLTDPLDGQYFQDTSTGSVYRYDAGTSNWELLVQYDRATGRIVNVNQATFTRTNRIGRLTSAITSSPVTSVNARLITAVQKGEDIKIVSSADETAVISLTVTADTGSGDVAIPVQSTITDFDFPANSVIIVEDGLRNVYTSVDPNKLQNRIEVEHTASSIGGLLSDILIGDTGVTSISLIDIDPIVRLADGKRLIITDKSGNSQVVIVDGDQVLSENQGSVTVQAFDPIYDYEVTRSFLYEPSYEATSRITQTESSILLQASQISDLSNSTASLNLSVAENAANITLLSGVTDGINSSISTLEANASAQQATLALLASVNDTQNSSIAGITIDVSNLEASVNTSVQYDDSGAYIELLAGPNGSAIELQANQINIDGIVSFINDETDANTTIDGGKITTNTIGASQINTESLFAQTISINEGNISFFDAGNEVMRLGEDSSNIGLFIYDVGGAQLSSFKSDGLIIGSDDSDVWNVYSQSWNVSPEFNNYQYVSFDPENGLFVRGQIRADDIISGTLNAGLIVGQEVKSENYTPNVSGFGIFSNGFAEFGNVTVRGTLVTGAGSAIEGEYVSNVNAGTITVGTLSADRIAANTITADKIVSNSITATQIAANTITADEINIADLYTTNATVNGVLTLDAGKLVAVDSGNSVTIDSNGITGVSSVLGTTFELPTDGSAPTFANGTVKEVTFEMYTSGVIRTSNNALTGDAGVLINNTGIFAGSAGQNTGNSNFRVSSTDGSLVAQSANIAGKLVAGAGSSIEGLYVSNLNASTITTGTINAALISVTNIDADNITTGTINASVISVINLDADNITTGSIDASQINVSNINAELITVGTLDADRLNVDEVLATNATIDATLSIGASGQLYYDSGVGDGNGIVKIDRAGLTLYANDTDTIGMQFGNNSSGTTATIKPTLTGHIAVSGDIISSGSIRSTVGNIRGAFQSSDGTDGITATRSWYDSAALETHNVTIKNGIITSWTVT